MKLLILLLVILGVAFSETCGGNCPGGKCPNCPCGTTKSMQDIATWCGKHSWNTNCCKCIVSHESGGNAHAMNYNSNGTFDVGLWQINHVNWAGCSGGSAPCTPEASLTCAVKVYQGSGNTWRAWSTHTACGC